ncbi:hypothetical protein YC2023_109896 [Brassica napus]
MPGDSCLGEKSRPAHTIWSNFKFPLLPQTLLLKRSSLAAEIVPFSNRVPVPYSVQFECSANTSISPSKVKEFEPHPSTTPIIDITDNKDHYSDDIPTPPQFYESVNEMISLSRI